MSVSPFTPLRNFSHYSVLDGLLRLQPWLQHLAHNKVPAAALTDRSNLFGFVKFYKAATQLGIKPLLGSQFELKLYGHTLDIVLIAQNRQGFKNLCKLLSTHHHQRSDSLAAENLKMGSGDILCIVQQTSVQLAERCWGWIQAQFPGRAFLGVERWPQEPACAQQTRAALHAASQLGWPPVIAHSAFFLTASDYEAQQVKICIQKGLYFGQQDNKPYHASQHALTAAEIARLYPDLEVAVTNTWKIAEKCSVILDFDQMCLPQFCRMKFPSWRKKPSRD